MLLYADILRSETSNYTSFLQPNKGVIFDI